MASVRKELRLGVAAEVAWALLRDAGAAHEAFPGVLAACRRDGESRTVTFASGNQVRERIVAIDEAQRRIAYAVVEGRFSHHSASMQIVPEDDGRCRFVWVSDFLPNELEPTVRALVEQGAEAFRRAAEARA